MYQGAGKGNLLFDELMIEKETVMNTRFWVPLLALVIVGLSGAVMADSDSKEVQALTQKVRALSDEVEQLRKVVESLQAVQPTVTSLMPEFAERFHVMHYAGESGDWAVSAHEMLALQRLINVIKHIDAEKGAMMEGFMNGSFRKLNAAIEHGNRESFRKALTETVKNCNNCHVAVGSPFMKVLLEARDSLSLRHSHDLGESKAHGPRTHKH